VCHNQHVLDRKADRQTDRQGQQTGPGKQVSCGNVPICRNSLCQRAQLACQHG
jgi:hypothetical protein